MDTIGIAGDLVVLGPDEVRTDAVVLVQGGRVVDVVPAAQRPIYAARLGGQGRIVLPGLINLHSHTPLMAVRGLEAGYPPAGKLNGFLLEDEELATFARLGALEVLAAGCTSVVDHYRRPQILVGVLREAGLRAWIGGRIHDADPTARLAGHYVHQLALGRATLEENEALVEELGSSDPLLSPILAPHAPDTCSPNLLRQVARLAQRTGLGVHIHLAQAETELAQLRARDDTGPVDVLERAGLLGPQLVGAHGTHLTPGEVSRLAAAGAAIAHNPIGNARAGFYAKAFALHRRGIRIGLGIDTLNGDMFEAMRQAVVLARLIDPSSKPTAREAFAWATTGPAAILGRPDLGRIAPGGPADLLVLDATRPNLAPAPRSVDAVVWNATAADVETVLVAGVVRWHAGEAQGLDRRSIVRSARVASARLAASGRLGTAATPGGGWTWLAL